jgi:hypothetical protein
MPGVEHAHEVERLHHVGAVLAGEREEGLEHVVAVERAHLLDHSGVRLGRVAADLEQREHERGELVAQGMPAKRTLDVGADPVDAEGREPGRVGRHRRVGS